MKRLLVMGAGGSAAANFVRSLRMADEPYHLVGTDAGVHNLMRAEVDERHLVPRVDDDELLPLLNLLIERHELEFVHAQSDPEVAFLSRHRHDLAARTFLPAEETVRCCQDKYASYLCWQDADLVVPRTVMVPDRAALAQAFDELGGRVWLRPVTGAGGRGALAAHDLIGAERWLDEHLGWGTYSAAAVLGPHSVTWMSLWHEGELVVAQGRERLSWELGAVSPTGVSGATGVGRTVADPVVDEIARAAVAAVDERPHGLFGVDMTYDDEGVPNPTEINIGRFFTTHQFFAALGVNMAQLYVSWGFGERTAPTDVVNPAASGMLWVRGVDFLPTLVSPAQLEEAEATLGELRRALGR